MTTPATTPRRSRRVASLVAALVVVAATLTATVAPSASAQSSSLTFALGSQSPWVAPGGGFVMQLDTAGIPAGATVALTLHDAVQSRTAFDASVNGGNLPPTRNRVPFAYDTLATDASNGRRVVTLPTTGLGTGVYPVEVDLRNQSDDSLAHFVTHAVVAPVDANGALTAGQPLNVVWVWPLRSEPALVAGTPVNPVTLADLQPTGRLGRQATQLAANTDVPLTLAPSPETLDSWAAFASRGGELATSATALRSLLPRDQVLTGPFVPLDMPSLLRNDLGPTINPELGKGGLALESFFGTHLDPSTALPGPLDTSSLRLLMNAAARQVIVHSDQLTPVPEKFTPARPTKIEAIDGDESSAISLVVTDTGFEKFLSGDDPPALRAAHLLSGLAVVAGEQPSIARGIAIANPDRWDADDTFVSAMLAGLRGNPMLKPTTVAGFLQAVPPATVDGTADGTPVLRQLAPTSTPAPPVTAARYAAGVANRNSVEQLVGPDDPRTVRADRALAVSLTSAWETPPGRVKARQLLRSINSSVDDYLSKIQVQPRNTITITSSKAEIPISFRNTGTDDVTVHLALESDRLLFPDGAERDVALPAQHNTTVRVAVETRGSGTAPVVLTVTTAGGFKVGTSRITVRSGFVSGVGVFLTIGAIVFLAVWWGWDIHRRRKRKTRDRHPAAHRLVPPSGQPA